MDIVVVKDVPSDGVPVIKDVVVRPTIQVDVPHVVWVGKVVVSLIVAIFADVVNVAPTTSCVVRQDVPNVIGPTNVPQEIVRVATHTTIHVK